MKTHTKNMKTRQNMKTHQKYENAYQKYEGAPKNTKPHQKYESAPQQAPLAPTIRYPEHGRIPTPEPNYGNWIADYRPEIRVKRGSKEGPAADSERRSKEAGTNVKRRFRQPNKVRRR